MKKKCRIFALFSSLLTLSFGFSACSDAGGEGFSTSADNGFVLNGYVPESLDFSVASEKAGTITLNGTKKNSIQEALTACTGKGEYTIELTPGTYDLGEDHLEYKGDATIKIKGTDTTEYGVKTVIKTANHNLTSEQSRSLLSFGGSGNLILENVSLWCTWTPNILDAITEESQKTSEQKGDAQLECVGYDGTGYVVGYNCSFRSHQDTMRTTGKAWFYKCYIEGDVDFIWMEQSGKVALYEECRIRAIGGRKKWNSTYTKKSDVAAYIVAPRVTLTAGANYYKGLVIYDSNIEASNSATYLGRNPWKENSQYYNNSSFVGCSYWGDFKSAWYSAAVTDRNNIFSGYNTDNKVPASSKGRRYSDATVAKEFAGRNNILNRWFDGETESVTEVPESEKWDVNALANKLGWDVKNDNSKSFLDGEVKANVYEYNFVQGKNGTFTTDDERVTVNTNNNNNGSHGVVLSTKDSITIKVDRACKITINGCQYGNGTMELKSGDAVIATGVSNKTDADGAGIDFVYQNNAEATLVLTATGTCYIHGLTIREFTEFVPVTKISVSGTASILERGTTQLTATLTPVKPTLKAVEWISSDPSVAKVSEKGLVQGIKAGTVTITCAATDGSGVKGSKVITVNVNNTKPVSGKTYEYDLRGGVGNPYFSKDTFLQLYGKSDNGGHGIVVVKDSYANLKVAGSSKITIFTCAYDNPGSIKVSGSSGTLLGTVDCPKGNQQNDDTYVEFVYSGAADTLNLTWDGESGKQLYVHKIKVEPYNAPVTKVTSIAVTASDNATTVPVKGTLQLATTVSPSNATSKGVTWKSSDTTKATVDANGLVTGVATGNVTITATAIDGSNVSGTFAIEVVAAGLEEKSAGYALVFGTTQLVNAYEKAKGIEYGIEFDGSNGKMKANGDNIQFNTNSVINVKVAAGCTVVPVRYKNTTGNSNFTVSERNSSTGIVSITSNANNYLMGLMVVPKVDTTKNAVINLGNHYTMQVQQHIAKGSFIELDMTSGKFRPNGGNAQINANSIIRIPVASGAVVDCTWYSGSTSDYADITYNDAHTEATITIKAGQNPYIKTVTITYPAN